MTGAKKAPTSRKCSSTHHTASAKPAPPPQYPPPRPIHRTLRPRPRRKTRQISHPHPPLPPPTRPIFRPLLCRPRPHLGRPLGIPPRHDPRQIRTTNHSPPPLQILPQP